MAIRPPLTGNDPTPGAEPERRLVDIAAARAFTAGLVVEPNGLPALEEFVGAWRRRAIMLASCLGAGRRVNFVQIAPVLRFDVPDTAGMSREEELDAYYDTTRELIGYRLEVVQMTAGRVAEVVERAPRTEARVRAMAQARADADAARRAYRFHGARRGGAGRTSHRRRARANAPPADESDGDPEPEPVARRARRAFCCPGWWWR